MEKRRGAFLRGAAAALALAAAPAWGCALAGGARLEGRSLSLAYRALPAPIVRGEPFALEILLCPKAGAPAPAALRADAWMPAHRHGMNYRPVLHALGGGRYRSEGWLFHMSGRWEFVFEAGGERLTHSVEIE